MYIRELTKHNHAWQILDHRAAVVSDGQVPVAVTAPLRLPGPQSPAFVSPHLPISICTPNQHLAVTIQNMRNYFEMHLKAL